MSISQKLSVYGGNVPNRAQDTPIDFADNVYNYQVWFDVVPGELNTVIDQINTTQDEILSYKNVVIEKYDATKIYHDETLVYRNDVIDAKDIILGYVIPTEATLSPDAINDLINAKSLENFLGFNF